MARWSPLVFLLVIALARADDSFLDTALEEEDGEERTVFTSGGTYYLALNTTYLLYYSLLAGTLLLAGLALSGLFGGSSAESTGYGQGYGYQGYQRQGQNQGFNRNKRYAEGFTDQLNLLAEAFHKYEIDETNGCQLYVACESSNIAMHRKNGPLAKIVYRAMKKISEPQNAGLYEDDKYLLDILSAFEIGSSGQSCQQFRKQCRKEKVFG